MANFAITVAKPDIVAHSVDYERKKFADFLTIQPGTAQITVYFKFSRYIINIQNKLSVKY